jgi:hypothetical protein
MTLFKKKKTKKVRTFSLVLQGSPSKMERKKKSKNGMEISQLPRASSSSSFSG